MTFRHEGEHKTDLGDLRYAAGSVFFPSASSLTCGIRLE